MRPAKRHKTDTGNDEKAISIPEGKLCWTSNEKRNCKRKFVEHNAKYQRVYSFPSPPSPPSPPPPPCQWRADSFPVSSSSDSTASVRLARLFLWSSACALWVLNKLLLLASMIRMQTMCAAVAQTNSGCLPCVAKSFERNIKPICRARLTACIIRRTKRWYLFASILKLIVGKQFVSPAVEETKCRMKCQNREVWLGGEQETKKCRWFHETHITAHSERILFSVSTANCCKNAACEVPGWTKEHCLKRRYML